MPDMRPSPSTSLPMSLDGPMDAQLEQEASPPNCDGHASFKLDKPLFFLDTDVDGYQHSRKRLKTKQDQEHDPSVDCGPLQPVRFLGSRQEDRHSFGNTHTQYLSSLSALCIRCIGWLVGGCCLIRIQRLSGEQSVDCDTGLTSQAETNNHMVKPAIQKTITTSGDERTSILHWIRKPPVFKEMQVVWEAIYLGRSKGFPRQCKVWES